MKKLALIILCLLLFPKFALAVDYSQDANNVGWFKMEDTGNESDEGGNTNNTLTETSGTIPTDADVPTGYSDTSRDWTASETEWLEHADGLETDINGANQDISIVCWGKAESSTANMVLVNKYDPTGSHRQYRVLFNNTGSDPRFNLSSNGALLTTAIGTVDISDGSWHHFAGVYNDTDIRVYIDGSLDSNGASNPLVYTGGIANENSVFAIGTTFNSYPTTDLPWDGLIDDVAIFDRELTSVEVSAIKTYGVDGNQGVAAARRMFMVN